MAQIDHNQRSLFAKRRYLGGNARLLVHAGSLILSQIAPRKGLQVGQEIDLFTSRQVRLCFVGDRLANKCDRFRQVRTRLRLRE